MISGSNNKNTNKNFTAALAITASVAVVLLFFTACGNGSKKSVVLDTVEDSLAYSMGSMQKVQYMHYIETSCNVDSTYRVSCFEGIEKGFRDDKFMPEYYDGINIGLQVMSGFVQKDKKLSDKNFAEGLIDGAFNKEKVAKLDTATVSYAYKKGLINSCMLTEYVKNFKYAGTTLDDFISGFREGTSSFGNPEKYAYVCGKVFGRLYLRRALNSLNMQIYGSDTTKTVCPDLFYAGFTECNLPDAAIKHSDVKDIAILADYRIKDSLYSDNRTKGEEFLKENAKKPGIQTLPSGIQYKIIKKGNGRIPTDDNQVCIHYVGKTIEGKVFSDTHEYKEPVPMGVKNANGCYREVLKLMPVGSVWEIYVPQNLAYGSMQTEFFKPFSTIIYEIELVKIIK